MFVGRNLVERLLDREGEIHILHRPGSAEKVEALIDRWTAERADDWRRPWADHVTTRYETKRLGDCDPVWLEFERA